MLDPDADYYYLLDEHGEPKKVTHNQWVHGEWSPYSNTLGQGKPVRKISNMIVAKTWVGEIEVSTVFISMNFDNPSKWWETLLFAYSQNPLISQFDRYRTRHGKSRAHALKVHYMIVHYLHMAMYYKGIYALALTG